MRPHRDLLAAFVVLMVLGAPAVAAVQAHVADDPEREQALVEALQAEDAALADRYIALHDERARALAVLQKVEAQYNGIGPGLRQIYAAPYRDVPSGSVRSLERDEKAQRLELPWTGTHGE
jgi:hypothetical protein